MSKLLKKLHPTWITGYHEHDSLLEHRFAEELTEEEQKKAWENYEAKKTETVEYVNRAVLMSQLHQQQNNMQATGLPLNNMTITSSSNNQPVPMPYMNQPHPPGTPEQGIDSVIQLAFQSCQQLTTLHRNIKSIDQELMKPGINNALMRDLRNRRTQDASKCYDTLQRSLKLITSAIQAYAAFPSYQAKLLAAKQFIMDSMRNASHIKM